MPFRPLWTGWLVNMNPCCIEHQLKSCRIRNELDTQGEPVAEQISGVRHYGSDILSL